jgi:exonuclease III
VTTYVRERFAPTACETDSLGGFGADIDKEGRVVLTDHGAFVLVNVYIPNAGAASGEPAAKPRLEFKLKFLKALHAKLEALREAGREVGGVAHGARARARAFSYGRCSMSFQFGV